MHLNKYTRMKIIQTIIFAERDKFTRERPRRSAIISLRIALSTINHITLGSTRWRRKRRKRVRHGCAARFRVTTRCVIHPASSRSNTKKYAYKYNAFLSHRLVRGATGGWLNGIWNRWSSTCFSRRTRAKRTRISTSLETSSSSGIIIRSVWTHRNLRDFESSDRPIVGARILSFSFKPTEPPVDRDRVCFSSGPRCLPSRMTYEFKELESTARDGEVQCNE